MIPKKQQFTHMDSPKFEPKKTDGQAAQAKSRLASDPNTSSEVLRKLAETDQPQVLERVAENPQTAPDTLEELSNHESAEVRSAVTENKNTRPDTLQKLAADENPDVRYRLAENAQTPPPLLDTLVEDDNPFVVARARETQDHLRSLAEQADKMLVDERFAEAEDLYGKLLAGLEKLLGAEHQEVASSLHKLAAAQAAQGKHEAAKESESRANLITSVQKQCP